MSGAVASGYSGRQRQLWASAILIISGLVLLFFVAATLRREPIVEFEAETAIVTFAVTGGNEASWNLPAKTAKFMRIEGDEPVDEVRRLGVGPLVLPPNTKVTIIRLAGEPLDIRIDAIDSKRPPFLIDGETGRMLLPVHANIRVSGDVSGSGECAAVLPQTAFRAAGAMEVGANISEDAFDEADQLSGLSEADFASRFVQPALLAGSATILGRTLLTGEPYPADTLVLRRGDVLQLAAPGTIPKEAGSFLVETAACGALYVRGVQLADHAAVQRLGSAPSPVKLSVWQMITGDTVVSVAVAIFAGLLGGLRIALDIAEFRHGYLRPRAKGKD
ncbi:hypothetical protein [Sphingopyxis fribergensis]